MDEKLKLVKYIRNCFKKAENEKVDYNQRSRFS